VHRRCTEKDKLSRDIRPGKLRAISTISTASIWRWGGTNLGQTGDTRTLVAVRAGCEQAKWNKSINVLHKYRLTPLSRCSLRLDHQQNRPIAVATVSHSKPVESQPNLFFLTGLPCVHWIQMRRTALVLGISSNLFDCTLNKISMEHIDALPQTGKFNGSAWNRSESPGSAWTQLSVIEAHR